MPTPAKAYTDPTGFIRFVADPLLPVRYDLVPGVGLLQPTPYSIMVQVTPESRRIPYLGPGLTLPAGSKKPHLPRVPTPPLGRQIIITFPSIYKEKPVPPTEAPPISNTEWNILWLQRVQLSKDNFPNDVLDVSGERDQLAELSMHEGHLIPFVIRTGPVGKPDPGLLKRYTAIEINGEGRAFVMAWVQGRLVAWGTLFAQEGPKMPRRLAIKRGLGNGYDIDIYIAFQGRLTGYEVFYEVIEGDQ